MNEFNQTYSHANTFISFRVPPYADVNVKEPVQVNYEVIYGNRKSEPKTFTYLPKRNCTIFN
jgi:Rel homology dimerisation domain